MTGLRPLTVHAYNAMNGAHLTRLPYTGCSWSDSINDAGQMSVDIVFSSFAKRLTVNNEPLRTALRPWKVILAVQRGDNVLHAGPVTSRQWDAASRKLSFTCGGGLTLLGKRLVLNHGLATSFHNGDVLVDDEHPAGDWALTLTGSYRDIARGIIAETLKWGQLPFKLPPQEGGSFTRTYAGWDLATCADRISDLTNLDDSLEYRFAPSIDYDGNLTFLLEAATELIDHHYQMNASTPGQRVKITATDEDGSTTTSEVWATGGKDDDKTIMCRATIPTAYRDPDIPFAQTTNTSHTTVSNLKTLQTYARSQAALGAWPSESFKLEIGEEWQTHVGDWLDVRHEDDYMGRVRLLLKVTDVSHSTDSDYDTIQARERA
jgi:hypothetical protein